MRVPFDQKSISILNRVHSAAVYGHNKTYGFDNLPFVAGLWFEADRLCDYGGEADNVLSTYPNLNEAWQVSLEAKEADDNVGDAENLALELENRIYIATCVTAALMSLEGSMNNPFEGTMSVRIMEEFKADREEMMKRIDSILSLPKPDVLQKGDRVRVNWPDARWARHLHGMIGTVVEPHSGNMTSVSGEPDKLARIKLDNDRDRQTVIGHRHLELLS